MNMYNPHVGVEDGSGLDSARPSKAEAEAAARTLLLWAGSEPTGVGLADLTAILTRGADAAYPLVRAAAIRAASSPTPTMSRRCPTCRTAPTA